MALTQNGAKTLLRTQKCIVKTRPPDYLSDGRYTDRSILSYAAISFPEIAMRRQKLGMTKHSHNKEVFVRNIQVLVELCNDLHVRAARSVCVIVEITGLFVVDDSVICVMRRGSAPESLAF